MQNEPFKHLLQNPNCQHLLATGTKFLIPNTKYTVSNTKYNAPNTNHKA